MNLVAELKKQLESLDLQVAPETAETLIWLLQEMLRWNQTHNLTAITDPLAGLEKHLVDSLTLLPHIAADSRLLDIGSGAGFPGLPLKLVRPDLSIVSVDAVGKKISFQKHVARKLKFDQFIAWHGRAEDLPRQSFAEAGFDLVVARAFSSITNLVEMALPCLRPGGQIIAMKGPEGESELAEAGEWLKERGLCCHKIVKLTLPVSGASRQLLVLGC